MNYFTFNEFDSPDLPNSGRNMDPQFLELLDHARGIAGIQFKINSGYRTPEHNEKVGGKPRTAVSKGSSHMYGLAVDILCNSSRDRSIILNALIESGFTRIGIANSFIHVDLDKSKSQNVIWVY
jgi:uncharacterized protein YcbK (DUF882 family)